MDVIRNKIFVLAALTVLGGAATAILALQDLNAGTAEIYAFWIALLTTSAASCLVIRENDRMESAKLISENRILHIYAAKNVGDNGNGGARRFDLEVFISCFGILINDKVIKFNQGRIQLKSVEIDGNYIVMTYGSEKKDRKIQLLHAKMDEDEIRRITDAFHYETGISPEVIRKKEEM